MTRRKNYTASLVAASASPAETNEPLCARIDIEESLPPGGRNPTGRRNIDLAPWLGRGIDEWVWPCVSALQSLLRGGGVQAATVVSYGKNGLPAFFEFLTASRVEPLAARPCDLVAPHLTQFVSWLKQRHPHGATAKSIYGQAKAVLVCLIDRGHLRADSKSLFLQNPFPGSNRSMRGALPLSNEEMQRLAAALKADIADIHHGRLVLPMSQTLTGFMLIIAMRSGMNTTPLLELGRDCLRPHPLPNMRVLESRKHRGRNTQLKTLRFSRTNAERATLPLDGVAVLNRVLEMTQPLVAEAPAALRARLWLYRSGQPPDRGQVTCLSDRAIQVGMAAMIRRRQVLGDDGAALRLNLSRLRKTMSQRLWRLSGGDLFVVADVMGHSPQVADQNYLRLDERMKAQGAVFVGEALPVKLRGSVSGDKGIPIPENQLKQTPTGGCKDTLYGDKAPKDGSNHCEQFTHCLGCPSYAIVGTVKDLHRLFSFQIFLRAEAAYYTSDEWSEWRDHRHRLIDLIDRFTLEHFGEKLVTEAKALVDRAPHRFWALRMEQATRSRFSFEGVSHGS